MTLAEQALVRLHRRAKGALLGATERPVGAVTELLAQGLAVLDKATGQPKLTAAGKAAAERLVHPGGNGAVRMGTLRT